MLINEVFWGYNPPILTFDPNFLVHPSTKLACVKGGREGKERTAHLNNLKSLS